MQRSLVLIITVALALRAWAALLLPIDFDEPIYVDAALGYAQAIRAGDLDFLRDSPANREHPPLVKLLYAGGALLLGDAANTTSVLYTSRALAVLAGVAAVAAASWALGPLAAGLLAIHTLTVKYTAQAYLESLPMLALLLALGAAHRPRMGWLVVLGLGVAAASKLTYPLVLAPALLALLVWRQGQPSPSFQVLTPRRKGAKPATKPLRLGAFAFYPTLRTLGLLILAGLVFLALSPSLWLDPLGRLATMLGFHATYTQSAAVAAANYPWFQPFIWLATAPATTWHPEVFFYPGIDGLIFLTALAGIPMAWREPARRWLVIGLLGGLLILLVWPTKWPQYTLPLVPLIVALADPPLRRLVAHLREWNDYWGWSAVMLPHPPRYAWIAMSIFGSFVAGIYFYGLAGVALGSIGWSQIAPTSLPLSSGAINALLVLPDGRMVLAGDGGIALGPANGPWQALADPGVGRVRALVRDEAGQLWAGGNNGVAMWDGRRWHAVEGPTTAIYALAIDGHGQIWAASPAGVSVRAADARGWERVEGVGNAVVLSIAMQDSVVWLGGMGQVWRVEPASGVVRRFAGAEGFGSAGVTDLLVDVQGRVWAATLGDGLAMWDGAAWHWMTPANSGLPSAIVTALGSSSADGLWVGTGRPLEVGGLLAHYDGQRWRQYLPRNSGFSGAEPTVIQLGIDRQLWIGTRSGGIERYQIK
ncbi:ligand-binding sensor domain-containing protein [Candidatus Oscillochloris fontis]|uniref:ligand-binding sensor domain-containing protein n=1 Tax=Candidatus Oscillochloris fontis TaxID=2496868 RepID=UPI00101CEE76|nr:transcriptional regulator [Candidatus Oscillochloris fontis]